MAATISSVPTSRLAFRRISRQCAAMISTLLIALAALAVQSVPAPSSSPAYQAPPVRPFEPAGPVAARDGEGATPAPRALDAPVTVDAYRGH